MRIVTSKQMKQIEQNSIQYQMSYLRLMENAGCGGFLAKTLAERMYCPTVSSPPHFSS